MARPLKELIAPDWAEALADVENQIYAMGDFLRQELVEGRNYPPAGDNVLCAFSRPLADVRVLIVGQNPYPIPGHAARLSFSVAPDVRPISHSLQSIYQKLNADLGIPPASYGDLNAWLEQGILLLNRVLAASPGKAGSHRGKGREAVITAATTVLVERDDPLVAILWSRDAQSTRSLLGQTPVTASAHPSPLSARNGFFGSRPFSRTNEALASQDADPVSWDLNNT